MPGMSETLTNNVGPLPVWAWAGLGTAGVGAYLIYRKKQSMAAAAATPTADSSNLGTVPISNLTTSAEPMPTQGDTNFINVPAPVNTNNSSVTVNPPAATPAPAAATGPNLTDTPALNNIIIHTPLPGYTGVAWSKLTPAARENLYIHNPAPGYTGAAWSQLSLATRVSTWVKALGGVNK